MRRKVIINKAMMGVIIMEEKVEKVYSNLVSIEVSNFDLIFNFAQRNGDTNMPKPEDIVASVIMSPQHAKIFSQVLTENVKNYEDIFGTLNIVADVAALARVQKQPVKE